MNRSRLLQILYDVGPTSRADLARIANVTKTTIGSIVQPLIDQGVLVALDPRPSGNVGGKPARPIWFSPDGRPIVAVHLMPASVRASLVSPTGEVRSLEIGTFSAISDSQSTIIAEIERCVLAVLPHGGPTPLGVGVAVGGMVDTESGSVVEVNLGPKLSGLPLGPILEASTGLPVYLEVHARVQALGDRWFGPGRRVSDFVSVYCAEAIGAGFVIDGIVHSGRASAGGEVGHAIVDLNGALCRCGKHGCWETIASHRWLQQRAAELKLPNSSSMTAAALFALPPSCRRENLIAEYARNIAVGLINIQQTLGSDRFFLHGDITEGGESFRVLIEEAFLKGIAPHPRVSPTIEFSRTDRDMTLLGATGIVLTKSFDNIG